MTPKQRVKMAVAHIQPDRPPIQAHMTAPIRAALADYFHGRSPDEVFEVDFRFVCRAFGRPGLDRADWSRPVSDGRPVEPGGAEVYDEWGVGYSRVQNHAGGEYMEATDLTFARMTTMDHVRAHPWPDPDDYDYSRVPQYVEQFKDYALFVGGAGIPEIIDGVGKGRGTEQTLMDIAAEDEVGTAIVDARVDYYYGWCKRALEAGGGKVDILYLGQDIGTQRGLVVSPACFDSFFRPRIQRFVDLAHDYGALAMLHSCGSTRALHGRFIDMGIDIVDSVQPEPTGMDPEELKREFGDKLTYSGMISTQQTLPHGTVEQCRAEARHRIDVIGKGGGYIFAPAHLIQPDTPIENVLAIFEEVTGKRFT